MVKDKYPEIVPTRCSATIDGENVFIGAYIFKDTNGEYWDQVFIEAFDFVEGLSKVQLQDGKWMWVDKDRRMFTEKQAEILKGIYREPVKFLELKTEDFRDKDFIAGAVLKVKEALLQPIEDKADVIDDYAKYCEELLTQVKKKKKDELEVIAKQDKENRQKKTELKDKIKKFDI